MDTRSSPDVFVFEEFRFDRRAGRLSRQTADGRPLAVSVGSRALAILGVLVERAGDLASKDEIMRAVWPGAAVDEANLTVQLSALRRVLDAGRAGGSCIQNIPGRGYRFLPAVRHLANQAEPPHGAGASPNDEAGPPLPDSHKTRSWGERTVKNIAQAIGVFGLAAKDIAALPEEGLPQPEAPGSRPPLGRAHRRSIGAMVSGGVLLVAALASCGWWLLHNTASLPTVAAVAPTASRPAADSAEDRRMSIIVLPFENSSGDPAQDGIAAGITRDVTDRLASPYSPLIPAAASAIYRDKTVDLHKVGRDHNVHFVLTGNARRQDGRLIVSATLYETDRDRTIWSKRFDRPDRGDEGNIVAGHITDGIGQASIDSDVARAQREHPNTLDKRDLYFAARASSLFWSRTKQNILAEIALIERALAADPDYVPALELKAALFARLVYNDFSSDRDADLATADKAADRALQLAPNDPNALMRKALVLREQGNFDGAAALFRKVIELDPMDGWSLSDLGTIQMAQGRYKEALESYLTAKQRIAETSPLIDQKLASALLANDRFPEAIAQAQLAIGEWPAGERNAEFPWLVLIAAKSENGQTAEARADLQKFLATPRTYRSIAEVQKLPQLAATPKLLVGLRHAGMPEE